MSSPQHLHLAKTKIPSITVTLLESGGCCQQYSLVASHAAIVFWLISCKHRQRAYCLVRVWVHKHRHGVARCGAVMDDTMPCRLHNAIGQALHGLAEGDNHIVRCRLD